MVIIYHEFRVRICKIAYCPNSNFQIYLISESPTGLVKIQILGSVCRVSDFLFLVWGSRNWTTKNLTDNADVNSSVT